ncbi:MAG TPA: hypothetical protein PLY70_07365 [Saprospiraceae bacterium]|nr:hypothetical protein [Saprospiraceae bacterium]HPN71642.1 hypothetical protein [Saprospiraceae bacterium]
MNRNNFVIMVIILVLASLMILLAKFVKPDANWFSYFKIEGKQPHDLGLTFDLLKDMDENEKIEIVQLPFYDYQKRKIENNGSLVIKVNFEVALDSLESNALLDFVEEGNELFFSASYFEPQFIEKIMNDINPEIYCMLRDNQTYYQGLQEVQSETYLDSVPNAFEDLDAFPNDQMQDLDTSQSDEVLYDGNQEYGILDTATAMPDYEEAEEDYYDPTIEPLLSIKDSCTSVAFFQNANSFEYCFYEKFKKVSNSHSYFIEEMQAYFNDEIKPLGFVNEPSKLNFIEIKWGKGKIFLHTQPYLFTNWFVKDSTGFDYLNTAFSFTKHKNLIWYDNQIFYDEDDNATTNKSPLKYLFSHDSLIWAWYTMLIAAGLFVFFYAKRRLRIMPILPLNQNTSIEFASSVGLMYYHEEKFADTALILSKNLHQYIMDKYGIKYQKNDRLFIEKISLVSNQSQEEITKLFQALDHKALNIYHSAEQVINIYKRIENFKKSLK